MVLKAFLDTNIILDVFHRDRPFHLSAKELFSYLDANKFEAFYSESVLTSMTYILRKAMTPPQINSAIKYLIHKVHLLPCFQSLIQSSLAKNPPDFEDALLYEIALHHQLDYFITSNIKDFKTIEMAALPVVKAEVFNNILKKEEKYN